MGNLLAQRRNRMNRVWQDYQPPVASQRAESIECLYRERVGRGLGSNPGVLRYTPRCFNAVFRQADRNPSRPKDTALFERSSLILWQFNKQTISILPITVKHKGKESKSIGIC
jgi:hypothetical protein